MEGIENEVVYGRTLRGYHFEHKEGMQLSNAEVLAVAKILLDSRAFTKKEMMSILDRLVSYCVPPDNLKLVNDLIANEKHHYIEPRHGKNFLEKYCGEYGSGRCKCKDRVNYAIQNHRINPQQLDYVAATEIPIQTVLDVKCAMEDIDDLSQDFSFCKPYQSPERTKHLIQEFLDSAQLSIIQNS